MGLPFKMNFFIWRVWKKRIATDDNLKQMRMKIISRCYCYESYQVETMEHLFLTSPIAQDLWKYFAAYVGIRVEDTHLQQFITY